MSQPAPQTTLPDLSDIRLVATDLDGTLLRHGQPIASATVAAVDDLLDADVHFLPVTGRPLHWLDILRTDLPRVGRVICANGAVLLNLADNRVEWASRISPETIADFAAGVHAAIPGATIGFETLTGSVIERDFAPKIPRKSTLITREQTLAGDADALHDVIKILLKVPGQTDSAGLLAKTVPLISGTLHGTFSNPANGLVELASAGVTKAHTLERFAESLGFDRSQVAAFGDMPNDVEMLNWAGAGFAMTGGHPDAQAAANALAPALDDGGIAAPLRAILAARQAQGGPAGQAQGGPALPEQGAPVDQVQGSPALPEQGAPVDQAQDGPVAPTSSTHPTKEAPRQ